MLLAPASSSTVPDTFSVPPVAMFTALPAKVGALPEMVNTMPDGTVTVPAPVQVPPLQVLAGPLSVRFPVPPKLPAICENVPATLEAPLTVTMPLPPRLRLPANSADPATTRLPLATLRFSVVYKDPADTAVLIVTMGLALGPRSIITVSRPVGTAPVLQLAATLALPLTSDTQKFTPANVAPRCT